MANDFDYLNESFPGLNKVKTFDEKEKRKELYEFFRLKAEEDEKREREIAEAQMKLNFMVDTEMQHDYDLIDNVFFSAYSKADNVAQAVIEMKEIALSARTQPKQKSFRD